MSHCAGPDLPTGPKLSVGVSCLGAQGELFSFPESYGRKERENTMGPEDRGDRAEVTVDGPFWAGHLCPTTSSLR